MNEFNSELRLDNSNTLVMEGDSIMTVFPNMFDDIEGISFKFLHKNEEIKLINIDNEEAVYFHLTKFQVGLLIDYLKRLSEIIE